MHIALLLHNIELSNEIINEINPSLILTSNQDDKFTAFRDLSFALDKSIYIDRKKIDWVLYSNNDLIRYSDFLKIESFISSIDNRLFYVEKHDMALFPNEQRYLYKNFYCRPDVFSSLGNVYKLKNIVNDLSETHFINITPIGGIYETDDFFRTWLYAINRNNFDIVSIP
jgi:hypothetical protein